MNKKSKIDIASILLIIFNAIFIVSIAFALSCGVIKPYYKELNKISIIIMAIVELIVFLVFIFISKKLSKKSLKILSIINICVFLLLLIIFGFVLAVTPTWDFREVYHTAILKAQNKITYFPKYYYVMYPNNIFVTAIWSWVYKLFGMLSISYLYGSITINIILIFASIVVTYFLIKDIYGLRVATVSSFLFLIATPLYAYAPIFYTDTLTMIFLPVAYLIYRKYLKYEKWKYLIIIGVLSAIGVGIKNNICIGIIALAIFAIFELRNIKKLLKFYIGIGVSFLIITSIINGICQANIPIKLDQAGFPYTHWIMMGLKGDGSWNQEDVTSCLKAGPNKENIKIFTEKVIKERLDAYGFDGLVNHLIRKNEFTWGDGTEYATFYLKMEPKHRGRMYQYVVGDKNYNFLLFSQGTQLFMLALIIIGSIGLFKDRKNHAMMFNICIFGVFVFLMIWETCPRYLLCVLPIMLASASNGINNLMKLGIFKEEKVDVIK
ncbi:glycosyltransferase family 39 protein [Clostridium thermobutyricum]|uniref:Glycosyltransferase RgtA/B/C/D-like domain-containing protein n=1 Tax=Clostridium thermobutyricum DSM 4928 TaxID=1121339 RepID=A0A1V4SUB6_9CLOT|nr:glycosyltransferase family 39 protein [Clostridium thermobutyricum]OPX47455.1 hypothetical protein CLTHE_20180 [Clostridium thermobutyricum DSM 4928]